MKGETIRFGTVKVSPHSRSELTDLIMAHAFGSDGSVRPLIMTSANGQVLSEAKLKPAIRELLERADHVSPDGQSLVLASKLFKGQSLKERVATTDLFHDVAIAASGTDVGFYMLGATQEECATAVGAVRHAYPDLLIVGSHHGYLKTPQEEKAVIDEIVQSKAKIVWLALGFPRELEFALRWREALAGVAVVKTSGGLFNFLSGLRSRAPNWMQVLGLEWVWRLALEPRRLFWRYLTTNTHSVIILVREALSTWFSPEQRRT